ncbi:hypothetical protein BGZ83_002821 [Gryganskiella cystojenkinii]|nr:hypothetical protein BGZ83_002821 [Gryganskiella cystojenkinii]
MALVRHLRYQRINALLAKYPDPTLPLRDLAVATEVTAVINELEFPFLNVVSLEFASFKTYAIPTISKILAATKQFATAGLKRADDTFLIILELNEGHSRNRRRTMIEGKEDEKEVQNDKKRSEIALERLNFIHGHYNIKQDDFLYTLAMFMLEPTSFLGQFEWRELTELEQNAHFATWKSLGKDMNIQNIPETKEEMKAWSENYEKTHAKFAAVNIEVAESTIDVLLSVTPSFTHGLSRQVVSALLTPRIREAFRIAPPPRGLKSLVHAVLLGRAMFIRHFMLPRRLPLVRTALRANSECKYVPNFHKYKPVYKDGYRVEDLGPERFLGRCPASFHPSGLTLEAKNRF